MKYLTSGSSWHWSSILFLPVLLGATALVMWPGIGGPFLMDDLVHLPKLEARGGVDSLEDALRFIFSGRSATGRPLSFATFLLNDISWPSDPRAFKYTNLMLHLLNAVLVFVLVRLLTGIVLGKEDPDGEVLRNWVALATAMIWAIHPMQLSPVMLVIQRMTLLMGTFTLGGLILYLRGRRQVHRRPVPGYLQMSFGIGFFGLLGALSKEPAVMLVCYVLALELTVLHVSLSKPPGRWRLWQGIFIALPLLGIAGYFLSIRDRIDELYLQRDFNMPERLMTEFRVLVEYLYNILLPNLSNTGPYRDDYIVSHGLFDPGTTIISMGLVLGAMGFACLRRGKNFLAAFAILWFFLAHLLESTILPIELYFEHRNYLPMLGPFFAVAYWAITLPGGRVRKALLAGITLFVFLEGAITYASSQVWGDWEKLTTVWAVEHPTSVRTRLELLSFSLVKKEYAKAAKMIEEYRRYRGDDASVIGVQLIAESCYPEARQFMSGALPELERVVPHARFEFASTEVIRTIVRQLRKDKCTLTPEQVMHVIDLYLSNEKFANHSLTRALLYAEKSKVYRRMGNLDGNIRALDRAYEASGQYDYRIEQALLLATAGLYDGALKFIEKAKQAERKTIFEPLWRDPQIERTEEVIRYMQMRADREKPNEAEGRPRAHDTNTDAPKEEGLSGG